MDPLEDLGPEALVHPQAMIGSSIVRFVIVVV